MERTSLPRTWSRAVEFACFEAAVCRGVFPRMVSASKPRRLSSGGHRTTRFECKDIGSGVGYRNAPDSADTNRSLCAVVGVRLLLNTPPLTTGWWPGAYPRGLLRPVSLQGIVKLRRGKNSDCQDLDDSSRIVDRKYSGQRRTLLRMSDCDPYVGQNIEDILCIVAPNIGLAESTFLERNLNRDSKRH